MRSLSLALWLVWVMAAQAYKILVYSPTISRSHMLENGRIADSLARAGHDVTLLELDYFVRPGTVQSCRLAKFWAESFPWSRRPAEIPMDNDFFHYNLVYEYLGLQQFFGAMRDGCSALLDAHDFIERVRAEHFDVILYEQFMACPLVLAELLGIEVRIWMSSCPLMDHQADMMGIPAENSYVPAAMNNPHGDRMDLWARMANTARTLMHRFIYYRSWRAWHTVLKQRYGDDFPSPVALARKADLLLINTDEFIDYPRPLPPNVVHIGGLGVAHHMTANLSAPYDAVMARGQRGVVYFSLGSIVPTHALPDGYMANFLRTFAHFPDYQFVVKLSASDNASRALAASMPNVFVAEWSPQPAILAHPRLRLFITHGGYNSIIEAAHVGVPLLSIGIFGDQPRNAKVVERNGWGLSLDKTALLDGPHELEVRLRKLLTDQKYKRAAQRIQNILRTKPQSGEQRLHAFVRLLEENGGHLPELHPISPHLTFVEYNNIDVWLLVTLMGAVLLAVLLTSAHLVGRLLVSAATNLFQKRKVD